ncbi:MAG: hypothetical protein R3F14_27350 [Polyangiaceae bacterium]
MAGPLALLLPATLAVLSGCAPEDETKPDAPTLTVVEDAPLPVAKEPEVREVGAYAGELRALGAHGGTCVLGTTSGAFAVEEAGLLALDIYGDEPDLPVDTGEVRAIGRRTETLLLAAETGIYLTTGEKLQRSPASDALADLVIREVHVTGAGSSERVWLLADTGVLLVAGDEVSEITVEGETEAPIAISPAASGTSLLVAYPGTVREIDLEANEARELPFDLGAVRGMARGGEKVVYFATDQGLFSRGEDGDYTHLPLSGEADPVAVDTVLVDPEGPLAITASHVIRLPAEGAPQAVATLDGSDEPHLAAADDVGLVWVGGGGSLSGFVLGSPVGFEADVAPVLDEYCMTCHTDPGVNGAPGLDLLDFDTTKEKASLIVQRIAAGQMPPPGATPLPAEKYELILRWYGSGQNP